MIVFNKIVMNLFYNQNTYSYLITNELDRSCGLTINTVGIQSVEPKKQYPVAGHSPIYTFNPTVGRSLNEYQLIYITKGNGELTIQGKEKVTIETGDVIFLKPKQWHNYKPDFDEGWCEYYIGFQGSIIDNLILNEFLSEDKNVFHVGLSEELVMLYKNSIDLVSKDRACLQQVLMGYVMHMIGLILFESQNRLFENNQYFDLVNAAKIIMNENIFNALNTEKLAEILNVNYSTFRKAFKKNTETSPAKYYNELIIRMAKQLLRETSKPIKEISYLLNFSSPEAFSINFKKNTGYSPKQFRQYAALN